MNHLRLLGCFRFVQNAYRRHSVQEQLSMTFRVPDTSRSDGITKQGMKYSHLCYDEAQEVLFMATVEKRTISLPSEQAAFIDAKVRAGDYASVSEVIRAGLRALKERDTAVERWLNSVVSTYDAMKADPARAVSVDAVFTGLRKRHEKRLKEGR